MAAQWLEDATPAIYSKTHRASLIGTGRTLKEILRRIVIPEDQTEFEREVSLVIDWYNEHRPHETLGGKTPNEVHFSHPAANEQPRIEPRKNWPRGSPCGTPQVAVEGDPGDAMVLEVDCIENRRHLPVFEFAALRKHC